MSILRKLWCLLWGHIYAPRMRITIWRTAKRKQHLFRTFSYQCCRCQKRTKELRLRRHDEFIKTNNVSWRNYK